MSLAQTSFSFDPGLAPGVRKPCQLIEPSRCSRTSPGTPGGVSDVSTHAANDVRIAALSAGKRSGVQVIKGEVLANHVHLLVSFRPDTRLSDFLRLAKSIAATRANRRVFGTVRWARGYYVTTIHKSDVPRVLRYIDEQFRRHPDLIPREPRCSDPGRKPGVNEVGTQT